MPQVNKMDEPVERLWTQREAAVFLGVTPRYLRDSSCPKVLLPGNGKKGHPILRYDPVEVRAWARAWHSGVTVARRAG
jgi:hypothetical protein